MMAVAMNAPPVGSPRPAAAEAPVADFDAAVLERCRRGDAAAFRTFVVRHEKMVFALLSRMLVGASAEAEDLAQETFVRAFRALPDFDPRGPAKVSTWLLTIATRLALDARKRRKVPTEPLGGAGHGGEDTSRTESTPELRAERRQLGEAIAAAAAALPDDQRAALVLADVHGLSIAEIATALAVPENTAKTRLFRARGKMRAALDEWRLP